MTFIKWKSICTAIGINFLLCSAQLLLAQCPPSFPDLPSFQPGSALVIEDSPCLPKTITLLNTMAGTNTFRYYFDYKGGSLSQYVSASTNQHTYTSPGQYTILLYSEKGGYPLLFCSTVTVPDPQPPVASLITCSNKDAKIIFDASQPVEYEKYLIEWGDGDIDEIFAGYRTATHRYANSNATYQIKAHGLNTSTGCRGEATTLLYTPTTAPIPGPSLISVETANGLETTLTVENPAKMPLRLLVSNNNGILEPTGVLSNNEADILNVPTDTLNTICYKLESTDNCLSNYQTGIVCSVPLSLASYVTGNAINIARIPQNSEVRATRVQLLKDRQVWKELPISSSPLLILDDDLVCGQTHCYQLRVHFTDGQFTGLEKCLPTLPEMCGIEVPLYIPAAFSPNNDAINDLFEIKGNSTESFEITIYNQWGSVLFHSTDLSLSWDGNYRQNPVPPGTYTYSIHLRDTRGRTTRKTGSVLLIR
jgi:gliding motility-associated-like protein